jgi:hypothetical protein
VTQTVLRDFVPPERLQNIQGRATATVAVEADGLSLERVRATAVLDRASLTLAGVPLTQSGPTKLRLENGRAWIEHFEWTAEGNSILASGGMSLAGARPSLELDVSGVLDLRVLGAFVSGAAAGGTADAKFTLSGPVDDPVIVGRMTVADADLQMDSPRLAASELEGTVRIAADRKVDLSLAGSLNTGSARVEGAFDLSELAAPIRLQFTGRGVAWNTLPASDRVGHRPRLVFGGKNSTLTGRVRSREHREPLVLSRLLSLSSATEIARSAADWTSRMRLDVAVATVSDVRIDNNYGRLDIGASSSGRHGGAPGRGGAHAGCEDVKSIWAATPIASAADVDLPTRAPSQVNFSQTRVETSQSASNCCSAAGQCGRKVTSPRA